MLAKIVSEKFVKEGKSMRRIVEFRDILKGDELPYKYTEGNISFSLSNDDQGQKHLILGSGHRVYPSKWAGQTVSGDRDVYTIYEGDEMSEEQFQSLIAFMREAGERLTEINLRNHWSGTEVFIIPGSEEMGSRMAIVIDRVLEGREKMIRIEAWSGIPVSANLPSEYLTGSKNFYLQSSGEEKDTAIIIPGRGFAIKIGDVYRNELWEEGKRYLADCVRILSDIKKKERITDTI